MREDPAQFGMVRIATATSLGRRGADAAPPARHRENRDLLCCLRRHLRPDRAPGQLVQRRTGDEVPDSGESPENPIQAHGLRPPDGPDYRRGRGLTEPE
jgi:hypothetical protein